MTACEHISVAGVRPSRSDDKERMDAFVRDHPDGTPFHLSLWIDAVEQGCGQRGRTLLAEDHRGRIVGVLPLTEVVSPLFGRALVSSGFAVGGGPLAATPAVRDNLLAAAVKLALDLGCRTLEIRGGSVPADGWHSDETSYVGFERELAADADSQLLAIPRKQRAEIRRALGLGLTTSQGSEPKERREHYAIYAESVRNLGSPVFPRALFDAVLDRFGPEADILTVHKGEQAVASVLSLYWRGTVMPYWGGGTREARALRANDLMYFALMDHARLNKGCTRFDFGRSKAGSGPAAFKRNWGFEARPLRYHAKSMSGSGPRDINPASAKYRMQVSLWKRLPLPIANAIGPLISRGLG